MKYKVGDKTLLGEITRAENLGFTEYLVDDRWYSEDQIDAIIIKPKRNIDHLADLWEMDSGAAYKFWKDSSRMNSVCTEPSKPPQLTPEELKALKLARDCGFNWIYKNIQGNIMLQEYSCGGR